MKMLLAASVMLASCAVEPVVQRTTRQDHIGVMRAVLEQEGKTFGGKANAPCVMPRLDDEFHLIPPHENYVPAPPPSGRLITTIDVNWLPKTLSLCPDKQRASFLLISSPSISGDEANVIVELHCGPMCGAGNNQILRRQNSSWNIVRSDQMWIS